ncbi:hypothetical protein ACO34A_17895 [Rhizobium sp. ACO-34A]|nr:hypothetical protein ACO34A_17895 [Rhizobium sp. ACO-34A]
MIPPSALPGISPSRREINWSHRPAHLDRRWGLGADRLPISPLEGEMPGRAEGGATARPSAMDARA